MLGISYGLQLTIYSWHCDLYDTVGCAGIGRGKVCFECAERVPVKAVGNWKLPICLLQSPPDAGCGHCRSAKGIQGTHDDRV